MKIHLLSCVYFWIAVVIYQEFTEAEETCKDNISYSTYCHKDRCHQPGLASPCKKTCGLCEEGKDCPVEHYKASNGSCVACARKQSPRTRSHRKSCKGIACRRGTWGYRCASNCSVGCVDNICYQKTGTCRMGCISCYEGSSCDKFSSTCVCSMTGCSCKPGFYGSGCILQCSANCKDKLCSNNGICTHGCVAGSYGLKCNKHCFNCNNNTCSRDAGTCKAGCKTGHFGRTCDKNCSVNCIGNICKESDGRCQKCKSGQFGDTCDKSCSDKCNTDSCDRADGSCSPCKPGFSGYQCNTRCPAKCVNPLCMQYNGSCQGCMDGYRGSHCNISCPSQCTKCEQYGDRCSSCKDGWYGQTCHSPCGNCQTNVCDIGGTCRDGCKEGWVGDTCGGECNSGCFEKHCNGTTGQCTGGCITTAYGLFCNNSCSDQCSKKRCNTTDINQKAPTCTEGCEDGWWGTYCDIKCLQHCVKCDRWKNNTCVECVDGKIGDDCSQTCSTGLNGENCKDVLIPSMSWHIWVLTSAVCILYLLVMIMIIKMIHLSSCTSRLPRGNYISPVLDDWNDIPLHNIRVSCDNSDHAYTSIAEEEEELSPGSVRSEKTDRMYEPVGNVINS